MYKATFEKQITDEEDTRHKHVHNNNNDNKTV